MGKEGSKLGYGIFKKLCLCVEELCLFNVVGFHLCGKLWFLTLDQCQQVCSNWLLMMVRYCTACMSYLLLFHWSFSFGASELVCTVVILFALLLAPVWMESITGRVCVREAKSECITLIKSTVCDWVLLQSNYIEHIVTKMS